MLTRRSLIKTCCTFPLLEAFSGFSLGASAPGTEKLKHGHSERLKKILAKGGLPYIDIESSCNSAKLDIGALAHSMDELGIGLMALSADIGKGQFASGVRYDSLTERLLSSHPEYFIPVGNGGQPPALTEVADEFLDAQEAAAHAQELLLFGEYEFRHYPSPRQVKRNETARDTSIPIDGPIGHRLFAFSQKTGLPFQIHYEVEDELLPALENMLTKYPLAKVIWCHVAQVRYRERAMRYTPAYLDALIKHYPNLYFDTAFGDAQSVYPPSQQRHARIWSGDGQIDAEWRDLIVAHPERFLSALDLGGDRMERIAEYDRKHRMFLECLPTGVRHQVAYGNAWNLLYKESFPG